MIDNKYFNNSATTSQGTKKFIPPAKRKELQDDVPTTQNQFSNNQSQPRVQNQQNYSNQNYVHQNYNQPKFQNQDQKPYPRNFNSNYTQNNGSYDKPYKKTLQNQEDFKSNNGNQQREFNQYQQGNKFNSFGGGQNKYNRPNSSRDPFKRNLNSYQTSWGRRHLRSGFMDKEVEAEEQKLLEDARTQTEKHAGEMQNYDHLEVEVINKFNLTVPETEENFENLKFGQSLQDNIDQCGYKHLSIIQKHAVPIMRNKLNIMASSQTGSGKTASFLLPIIQDMIEAGPPSNDIPKDEYKKYRKAYPLALIIAPTRELALQIHDEARKFCHSTGIISKAIYGGKDSNSQQRYLSWDGCDILVACPGKLIDFMEYCVDFSFVKYIVLDEADRMFEMGFEDQINAIMKRAYDENPNKTSLQIAMFSATFPKNVMRLAESYLGKYVKIVVGSSGKIGTVNKCIKQSFIDTRGKTKTAELFELMKTLTGKILVFCAKKKDVGYVYNYLSAKNLFVTQINGNMSQPEREEELKLFRTKCSIMIATDVASRGLDIPDVAHVINYDLPQNIESYIHRVGRTGRIGKQGNAISFVSEGDDIIYAKLYGVLKDSEQEIPDWLEKEMIKKVGTFSGRGGYRGNRGGFRGYGNNGGGYRGGNNRGKYSSRGGGSGFSSRGGGNGFRGNSNGNSFNRGNNFGQFSNTTNNFNRNNGGGGDFGYQ